MRRGIKQKFNTIKTMQDLQAYYQQQFSNFWAKSFPDKTCPPLPKKLEDVGLSVRLAMEEEAPELFQNLFRSDYSAMPADTATRLRENRLWTDDIPVLKKYGWTAKAKELEGQVQEAKRIIAEKKLAEMKARNDEVEKRNRERPKGMQFAQPLPYEQVLKAREQWGISGN